MFFLFSPLRKSTRFSRNLCKLIKQTYLHFSSCYLSLTAVGCHWVSLCVCLFPNFSKTVDPNEQKFWGMQFPWKCRWFKAKKTSRFSQLFTKKLKKMLSTKSPFSFLTFPFHVLLNRFSRFVIGRTKRYTNILLLYDRDSSTLLFIFF